MNGGKVKMIDKLLKKWWSKSMYYRGPKE